jgi:DNA protecting protein DprA
VELEVKKILWFLNCFANKKEQLFVNENCLKLASLNEQANFLIHFLNQKKLTTSYYRYFEKNKRHHPVITRYELEALLNSPFPPHFPLAFKFLGNPYCLKDKKTIGIVGSRHPTSYALKVTSLWSERFLKEGYCVVSGGAIGIDTCVHKKAFELLKPTCVVLGSGLNHLYPPSNKPLFEKLIDSGVSVVLSSFDDDVKPLPYHFPLRNEFVALLSKALYVMEAGERSGTLITAKWALEYGVPTYVLKPPIAFKDHFKGNQALIDMGLEAIDEKGILGRSAEA